MKIAKPYKILALIVVLFVATAFYLAFSFGATAKAEVSPSTYFSYDGRSYQDGDVLFTENKAVVKLYGENYRANIVNKLDLTDFAVSFYLPDIADGDTFTVKFTTDSLYKTGNKTAENEYETTVDNQLVLKKNGNALKASFNGGEEQNVSDDFDGAKAITVYTETARNSAFLAVKIAYDGNVVSTPVVEDGKYYIDATSSLEGKVGFIGGENKTVEIETVNQKYSDGTDFEDNKFVQDFKMNDDREFLNKAYAKVYLPSSVYYFDGTAYRAIHGYKYSASLTGYSFLGNFSSSNYKVKGADESVKVIESNLSFVSLSADEEDLKTVDIKKGEETVASFGFYVVNYENDETAPKYVDYTVNPVPRDSFAKYLDSLIDSMDDSKEITVEKSKLASLVKDDYSGFDLMSATLYYWSDNNNGSSSSLKLSLKDAGHYRIIILFTDYSGNAMEQAQFFYKNASDQTEELYGEYGNYIFEFDVEDDNDLSITVGASAGTGYKGVNYSCSAFTIEGDDYTVRYGLYYSATEISADSDGWQKIVSASEANDEGKTYGAFTYSEIKAINYDGTLGFTPDRVGYYKFTCEVDSTVSAKSDGASVVFEVKEQVKTVVPDTHWFENNVWSVVFLSIGTLSLIGIIILLFIKPKDEDTIDK